MPETPRKHFDYDEAFSRNIGWVTRDEQARLRGSRVAIAGMGGVGGAHLVTHARLGIGAFTVADFDTFGLANFNRQAGARMSTLGRPKVDVLAEMARDVNPEASLRVFAKGVTPENIDAFLEGADVYVDGLDFFAFSIRRAVFARCRELGIPAVTVAPIGMGAALLNFLPGGMSFDEYFGLAECGDDEEEMGIRFLIGLSPALLQRPYLVDPSAANLAERRGPSTAMACELCAGIAATETLKLLLGRGRVLAAPRGMHFDAFRCKMVRTWRPWGNANPRQKIAIEIARRVLRKGKAG